MNPEVQSIIQEFLNEQLNDEPSRPINPGEAVGYSAASAGRDPHRRRLFTVQEAADIAAGSITEAAFEEALAQVEKEDGAPVPLKLKKVGQKALGASETGVARKRSGCCS